MSPEADEKKLEEEDSKAELKDEELDKVSGGQGPAPRGHGVDPAGGPVGGR